MALTRGQKGKDTYFCKYTSLYHSQKMNILCHFDKMTRKNMVCRMLFHTFRIACFSVFVTWYQSVPDIHNGIYVQWTWGPKYDINALLLKNSHKYGNSAWSCWNEHKHAWQLFCAYNYVSVSTLNVLSTKTISSWVLLFVPELSHYIRVKYKYMFCLCLV